MLMSWLDVLVATCGATIGALVVLVALRWIERRASARPIDDVGKINGPVFLFHSDVLVDASRDASAMIEAHTDHMTDLDATLHVLTPHFPALRGILQSGEDGFRRLDDKGADGLWLEVQRDGDRLRIAIHGSKQAAPVAASDVIERDVRLSELAMLRDLTQHTPQLIWQEDQHGRLLWANHAYLSFCDTLRNDESQFQASWPNAPLFPDLHKSSTNSGASLRRLSVNLPKKRAEQWFDVTSVKRDQSVLHFANDANAVVRADQERRNFVHTLGKTFAELSIGLAIFDKRRQLAMFNPAMVEMTQLPIEFLSGRPTIDAVLDKLRESRMLPEPKNYTSWREQFTALEAAAKDGSYSETWNLPDGQTYRVTGRPHPDGAFAFLFEDISAEISLTRRFRSDIETGQAVLDTLPDAIAVFSSAGTMVMSNRAYADLWGHITDNRVQQYELMTAVQVWQSKSAPSAIWAELRSFIHRLGARQPWSDDTILDDGRQLQCQANPIAGGMTMVKFSVSQPMKPVIQKLTATDTALLASKR